MDEYPWKGTIVKGDVIFQSWIFREYDMLVFRGAILYTLYYDVFVSDPDKCWQVVQI